MKNKVKDMYENVTMPVSCEEKIRRAAEERKKPRYALCPVLAVAAVLALVIFLAPPVRAAVEDLMVIFFDPESELKISQKSSGEIVSEVTHDPDSTTFAEVRDGQLYFVGNGENIDITDQVQDGKPFLYTYKDREGRTVYKAVGIVDTVESFGTQTFVREANGDWLGGSGSNAVDPETGLYYPWSQAVWKELNHIWPLEAWKPEDAGTTEVSPFAEMKGGRLYFTGHGENLDISDQVQNGKPYIYTYEEGEGYKVYLIVGMAGTLENYGTYTFVRGEDGQWLNGGGENFADPETRKAYPWAEAVWQELNLPWPMPGE